MTAMLVISQINLVFRSACTTLRDKTLEVRLRLGKTQINLVFRSACTNFAYRKKIGYGR